MSIAGSEIFLVHVGIAVLALAAVVGSILIIAGKLLGSHA